MWYFFFCVYGFELFLPVPAHLAAAICARHKTTTSLTDSPSSAAFPSIPSPFNTHYPPIALPLTEVTTVICTPVHPRITIPFLRHFYARTAVIQDRTGRPKFPVFLSFFGDFISARRSHRSVAAFAISFPPFGSVGSQRLLF